MTDTQRLKLPLPRYLAFLQAITFTAGQMIWIALYVSVGEEMGLSISQVLVTFALGSALYLVGSPFWASKSEKWGRQNVLRISVTSLWLTFTSILALCLWKPSSPFLAFVLLILSRSLYGLVASAIPAVTQAVHKDHTTSASSSQTMLSHSLSLNFGRILGLVVVVSFSGNLIPSFLFYVFFSFTVMILSFIPISSKKSQMIFSSPSAAPARSWKQEWMQIRWVIALAFVFALFGEALNSSLGPTLKKTLLISSSETSETTAYLLLFACIGVALIQLISRLFFKLGSHLWLYMGLFSLFFGSILYTSAASLVSFWLSVSFFIIGLGLVPPFYMAYLHSQGPMNYGKRVGLISAAHTIGSASGVGLSALALSIDGVRWVGIALTLLVFTMAAFNWLHQSRVFSQNVEKTQNFI